MKDITIRDEFIKLGQALKLAGLVQTGAEAKETIERGEILVNGEVELRRGRKLREGDEVSAAGQQFVIHSHAASQ